MTCLPNYCCCPYYLLACWFFLPVYYKSIMFFNSLNFTNMSFQCYSFYGKRWIIGRDEKKRVFIQILIWKKMYINLEKNMGGIHLFFYTYNTVTEYDCAMSVQKKKKNFFCHLYCTTVLFVFAVRIY